MLIFCCWIFWPTLTHGRKSVTRAPDSLGLPNPTKKLARRVDLLGQPLYRKSKSCFQNFQGGPPPPPPHLNNKLTKLFLQTCLISFTKNSLMMYFYYEHFMQFYYTIVLRSRSIYRHHIILSPITMMICLLDFGLTAAGIRSITSKIKVRNDKWQYLSINWITTPVSRFVTFLSPESTSNANNSQAQRVLGSLKKKLEGIEEGVVLGIEGQINYLIRKAQDPANLSRIFVGWQAWVWVDEI